MNDLVKRKPIPQQITLQLNNKLTSDPMEVAEAFNYAVVNVASKYIDHSSLIAPDLNKLKQFVDSRKIQGDKFNIPFITKKFVIETINSMSTTKATGLDQISVRILKICVNEIADSLADLINKSIETSTFPELWKIARVNPIHKSGLKTSEENYRPISILPIISKICERHIHLNLMSWLQQYHLLLNNQSAYIKNHSCVTTLIDIIDTLLLNMDKGNSNGLLLLDLSKAFDLIDHNLLIRKLKVYGLSQSSLDWFNSYLSERKQVVSANGALSNPLKIQTGVPQESILGPLLFIIYLNDLPLALEDPKTLKMFADDSTLLANGKTLHTAGLARSKFNASGQSRTSLLLRARFNL